MQTSPQGRCGHDQKLRRQKLHKSRYVFTCVLSMCVLVRFMRDYLSFLRSSTCVFACHVLALFLRSYLRSSFLPPHLGASVVLHRNGVSKNTQMLLPNQQLPGNQPMTSIKHPKQHHQPMAPSQTLTACQQSIPRIKHPKQRPPPHHQPMRIKHQSIKHPKQRHHQPMIPPTNQTPTTTSCL